LTRLVDALADAGDTARARSLLAEVLVLGNWYESVTLRSRFVPSSACDGSNKRSESNDPIWDGRPATRSL
jgi:hypothetical protein